MYIMQDFTFISTFLEIMKVKLSRSEKWMSVNKLGVKYDLFHPEDGDEILL